IKRTMAMAAVCAMLLMCTAVQVKAQCNEWEVMLSADSSTCPANGKVRAKVINHGSGSLSNLLYSLQSRTPGGHSVYQSRVDSFMEVPAGTYDVIVEGICNDDEEVSWTSAVFVPGNYQTIEGT